MADGFLERLDRELVFEFFWRFSAFECALKRAGYLKKKAYAEADWEAFGVRLSGRFSGIQDQTFAAALELLDSATPRRQVVRGGMLGWEELTRGPKDTREAWTIRLMKTVRNNLFHGGKYPDGPIDEVERDDMLLRAALAVLKVCSELENEVHQHLRNAALEFATVEGRTPPVSR